MSEMIEKVARALFSANTGTSYYETFHPSYERDAEYWETLAKAAIEAATGWEYVGPGRAMTPEELQFFNFLQGSQWTEEQMSKMEVNE